MNKLLITSAIAAPLVVGAGAFGGYKVGQMQDGADDGMAELVSAVPTTKTVQTSTPRQECRSVPVHYTTTERRNRSNEAVNIAGGAVIGGVIGNAVGGRRNRDATTLAGAALGGYLGHERAERRNAPRTVSRTRYEQRCDTVHERHSETRNSGYDVTYRYQGQLFTTHMEELPPARFPVAVNVVPASDAG